MSQAAIEALLKEKIGLDPKIIGSSLIARAINRRISDCKLSDLTTYLKRLQTSTEELNALIENVVVPETWFFRDRKPFDFLSHYVKSEWVKTRQNRVLRVLSVPCSTGEEPYSIAIALLEAGLTSKNFHIDAVDISKKSLERAKTAIYSENSFRGGSNNLQERYFTKIENGYQLYDSIKKTVNFIHGNLLDPQFSWGKKPYHIIFCRNLLIYLDQSARKQAIQALDRLLTNDGLLFLGHSETGQTLPVNFVPVRHASAFAFRKGSDRPLSVVSPKSFPQVTHLAKIVPPPSFAETKELSTPTPITPKPNPPTTLELARVLADRGQLEEAARLCETYLSENRISAEAYFLRGQVHQAMGQEAQAEQCFHKAIYLEPQHHEALIHLALLKEYQGDKKNAALLRQRIQRLETY